MFENLINFEMNMINSLIYALMEVALILIISSNSIRQS